MTLIVLAVFGGLAYRAYYVASPEERDRYLLIAMGIGRRLKVAATERAPEDESFRDALRARTAHALVTPAIVLISAAIAAGMIFGSSAVADSNRLVAWGASLGTRTTNGEWWRLVTSTFVFTGTFHFLISAAVLIQLGGILERLVGRLTFAAVYLSAGMFAGLVNLSAHPVAVTVGAPGAIFGLYGLLLASLFWQLLQGRGDQFFQRGVGYRIRPRPEPRPEPDAEADNPEAAVEESAAPHVTIPVAALKRLGVGAAVFVIYSAVGGFAQAAEFTGLLVGLTYGLVLAWRLTEQEPTTRHVAVTVVATAAIMVACAWELRNIADVKPEIARVLATEERTAAAYQTGVDAFKKGRISAEALAQFAERNIMPELQAADARLKTLSNVPPEHQPLVADAREYLRLRTTSWRARADAIRRTFTDPRRPEGAADARWRLQAEKRFRSDMAAMGNVEGAERVSLEAFQRIR